MTDPLPDQRFFNLQSQFCSIFSNPTRIKIFYVIQDGEKTVTEIADTIGYAIPNISQHLRLLKDKGAVLSQKRGREVAPDDPRPAERLARLAGGAP